MRRARTRSALPGCAMHSRPQARMASNSSPTLEPFCAGSRDAGGCSRRAHRAHRRDAMMKRSSMHGARDLRAGPDASSAVARASMGDALDDANFFELQRFFDACDALDVADCRLRRSFSQRSSRGSSRMCARA